MDTIVKLDNMVEVEEERMNTDDLWLVRTVLSLSHSESANYYKYDEFEQPLSHEPNVLCMVLLSFFIYIV